MWEVEDVCELFDEDRDEYELERDREREQDLLLLFKLSTGSILLLFALGLVTLFGWTCCPFELLCLVSEWELAELWVDGDELEEWVVVEDEDDTDLDDRLDGIDSNVLSATVGSVGLWVLLGFELNKSLVLVWI